MGCASQHKVINIKECSEIGGYEFALQGGQYKNTCPISKHANFLKGYDKGKIVHQLRREIRSLDADIRRLQTTDVGNRTNVSEMNASEQIRKKTRQKQSLEKRLRAFSY